jgi:prepilin-type N-terminal cleavage/methylation domain-containing protein/prepilin-type processing-associated H-X9-DG protein
LGFTLVELLVVVTVITVLVSMLLPVLFRVRADVNVMTCESNLRQISQATVSYAASNNGSYPYPATNEMPEDWIYWEPGRDLLHGGIARYLSTSNPAKILVCPVDDVTTHLGYPSYYYPFSYSMNINVAGYYPNGDPPNPCYYPNRKLIQVKHPQNCILFIHESEITLDDGCWAWQALDGSGRNMMSAMHDQANRELYSNPNNPTAGRGTVVFCDGHAGFVSRADSWNSKYFDPTQ